MSRNMTACRTISAVAVIAGSVIFAPVSAQQAAPATSPSPQLTSPAKPLKPFGSLTIPGLQGQALAKEMKRYGGSLIQQVIPGQDAGDWLGQGFLWGVPRADTAAEDLRLLRNPDPNDPRSRRQVECDRAMAASRNAYDAWVKKADAKALPPDDFERFPSWYRTTDHAQEKSRAAPVAAALQQGFAKCFDAAPPESFPAAIVQAIGALSGANDLRVCSVIRLERQVVATARHCLEPQGVRLSDTQVRQLVVHFGAPAPGAHPVLGYVRVGTSSAEQLANDWALLEIDALGTNAPFIPIASVESVPVGSRLAIGGLLIAADPAQESASSMFTATLSCMVAFANEDCLVHSCNTLPGMSGAPIFSRVSNEWKLVGLHSRPMDAVDFAVCRAPGALPERAKANGGVFARSFRPIVLTSGE